MTNHFFVSKDRHCKNYNSLEPSDWKNCRIEKFTENNYTLAFHKNHVKETEYSCGCLIFDNKYYPEFKMPEMIFKDFFHDTIGSGEKLIRFNVQKTNKK